MPAPALGGGISAPPNGRDGHSLASSRGKQMNTSTSTSPCGNRGNRRTCRFPSVLPTTAEDEMEAESDVDIEEISTDSEPA